jgi:hypothetical protein
MSFGFLSLMGDLFTWWQAVENNTPQSLPASTTLLYVPARHTRCGLGIRENRRPLNFFVMANKALHFP